MAKIISISTEVPAYKHTQQHLRQFMEGAYGAGDRERRILNYLYSHSGIDTRYSVIPDYTTPMNEWEFYPRTHDLEPFPGLETRMEWFQRHSLPLSLRAANKCIDGFIERSEITHLITVSCTGMSAPGLELQLMEAMGLKENVTRTAINFMGCYAAIHGLKMANDIVNANAGATVLMVCTELCSLHFQKTFSEDSITAPLIFGDGCAAALICGDDDEHPGLQIDTFYSEVLKNEKNSMTWNLSSQGFIMTLSPEVPDIFLRDIGPLKERALAKAGYSNGDIEYWCIHPGGKRILEAVEKALALEPDDLCYSRTILRDYGNMSSATVLFVLAKMWRKLVNDDGAHVFMAAFGPGLTMESAILTVK